MIPPGEPLPNGVGVKLIVLVCPSRVRIEFPPETSTYHSALSDGATPVRSGTHNPKSSMPSPSKS